MSKKKQKSNSIPTAPPSYSQTCRNDNIPHGQPPPYTPNSYQPYQAQPYPTYQPAPSNVTVYLPNQFDSGARFDLSRPTIPPPPPGIMPNAAQMAAMQGHNVVVTQKKSNFWFGDD